MAIILLLKLRKTKFTVKFTIIYIAWFVILVRWIYPKRHFSVHA